MATSFLRDIIKGLPAESSVAVDGKSSSEFDGYIDTGSYTLNAALSGSIFGGMPKNKFTAFAGDPATGKTFLALGVLSQWLKDNQDGVAFYFDTESATTNQMMTAHGIDLTRVVKSEPETIESFRQTALKIADRYAEVAAKDRPPMLMILDSLGNMSSSKEMQDTRDEKDTKDMTKAGLLKGAFRILRLRLTKLGITFIINNHTYANVGNPYGPPRVISGGCLVEGTKIIMGDGSLRNIEDVYVGDLVTTFDGVNRVSHAWTPTTLENGTPECLQIEWEDGTTTTVSETHSFVVGDRWVMAKDLVCGDTVETIGSINKSRTKPRSETLYAPRLQNNLPGPSI